MMKTRPSSFSGFLSQLFFGLTLWRRRSSRLKIIKAGLIWTDFKCPTCQTPASDAYANFCSRCGAAFMSPASQVDPRFNQQPTTGPIRNAPLVSEAARAVRPAGARTIAYLRAVRLQKTDYLHKTDYYPLLDRVDDIKRK